MMIGSLVAGRRAAVRVNCHDAGSDAPRDDFQVGDVPRGVVGRIPLQ